MHNKLTLAFRDKGLTTDAVAQKLGVSYQTLVQYTSGRQPIAKARGEAIDDILERERGTTQMEQLRYIVEKYDFPCSILEGSNGRT